MKSVVFGDVSKKDFRSYVTQHPRTQVASEEVTSGLGGKIHAPFNVSGPGWLVSSFLAENVITRRQEQDVVSEYLQSRRRSVESALSDCLPSAAPPVSSLVEAMRYATFAGGKRLRPLLCIAAAEMCGATAEQVLPAACALELIHTFSLIHDDLPALDNDSLRRGQPACHIRFGEAIAILAGDALLVRAFELFGRQESLCTRADIASDSDGF